MISICAGRPDHAVTMGGARVAPSGRQNAPIEPRSRDRIREANYRSLPFVSDVDRVRP